MGFVRLRGRVVIGPLSARTLSVLITLMWIGFGAVACFVVFFS